MGLRDRSNGTRRAHLSHSDAIRWPIDEPLPMEDQGSACNGREAANVRTAFAIDDLFMYIQGDSLVVVIITLIGEI